MAAGDIGSVIASLEFEAGSIEQCDIIHIAGDVYAIAYGGTDDDGWIKTVTINSAGAIALVGGGSLEFDDVRGRQPDIIHVSGNVYAVAYSGDGFDGWIKTVTISGAGAIALVSGGSLEFDTSKGQWPNIIHIAGNVYAVAYQAYGDDGWLKTLTISDAGAMSGLSDPGLEFDTTQGKQPGIIHIADDVYAIAYQDFDGDGRIKTVTISDAGVMALVSGGDLEFDDTTCTEPDIIHVAGNVYAIAYGGPLGDGWIKTLTISDAGAIALVAGGSLEFDVESGLAPRLIHVSENIYAIAYRGYENDGWLKTVTISDAGAMSGLSDPGLEFDTVTCNYPDMIHISGNVYAIAYQGEDTDGWIKTMAIEGVSGVKHLLVFGIG